jgi:hypothetical protein
MASPRSAGAGQGADHAEYDASRRTFVLAGAPASDARVRERRDANAPGTSKHLTMVIGYAARIDVEGVGAEALGRRAAAAGWSRARVSTDEGRAYELPPGLYVSRDFATLDDATASATRLAAALGEKYKVSVFEIGEGAWSALELARAS